MDDQLDDFARKLDQALPLHPRFATTMAGSDLWTFRDSVRFLTAAHELAKERGLRVGFETHRSRSLFHPIRTRELLAELPPIELTLDFSHWCVVTERLVLDELPDVLRALRGSSAPFPTPASVTTRGPRFPIRAPRSLLRQSPRTCAGGAAFGIPSSAGASRIPRLRRSSGPTGICNASPSPGGRSRIFGT